MQLLNRLYCTIFYCSNRSKIQKSPKLKMPSNTLILYFYVDILPYFSDSICPFSSHRPQAPSRCPRAPLLSYACCPAPRLTSSQLRSPVLGRVNPVHSRALILTASLPRGAAHQVSFSVFLQHRRQQSRRAPFGIAAAFASCRLTSPSAPAARPRRTAPCAGRSRR